MRTSRLAILTFLFFASALTAAEPTDLPEVASLDAPYDLPDRLEVCDRLIAKDAKRADAYLRRGQLRHILGDHVANQVTANRLKPEILKRWKELSAAELAHKDYDTAEQLGLKTPELYTARGWLLKDQGEYRKALDQFEQAIALTPPDDAIPITSALECSRKLEDNKKTLALIDLFLKRRQGERLGDSELKLVDERLALLPKVGRQDEALAAYRDRIAAGPVTYDFMWQYEALVRAAKPDELVDLYRKWIEKNPTYGGEQAFYKEYPRIKLAEIYVSQRKYTEALEQYAAIEKQAPQYALELANLRRIEAKPQDVLDLLRLAAAYRFFGDSENAFKIYDAMAQKFQTSPLLFCHRAMARLEMGDEPGAFQEFVIAEKAQADSPYVDVARAAIMQSQGSFEAANLNYEQALEKNPYMAGLRGRLEMVRLALGATIKYDAAYNHQESMVLEVEPIGSHFPMRLALSKDTAADVKSASQQPLNTDDRKTLARKRFQLGDVRTAIELLRDPQYPIDSKNVQLSEMLLTVGDYAGSAHVAESGSSVFRLASARRDGKVSWRLFVKDLDQYFDVSPGDLIPSNLTIGRGHGTPVPPAHGRGIVIKPLLARFKSPQVAEDFLMLAWNEGSRAFEGEPGAIDKEHLTLARENLDKALQAPSIAAGEPLLAATNWLKTEVDKRRAALDAAEAKARKRAALLPEFLATEKQAEAGNADAQFRLGLMLFQVRGPDRDLAAAETWFQKAADQGHEQAKQALAQTKQIREQQNQSK